MFFDGTGPADLPAAGVGTAHFLRIFCEEAYIQDVHDLGVHQWRRRHARGQVIRIRYADDSMDFRTRWRRAAASPTCANAFSALLWNCIRRRRG